MKTRILPAAIAAVLTGSLMFAQPAAALIVFDPSNFVQNMLTAIQTLQQLYNQIKQLQNEAKMLENQARNLASLPSSVVGQLRANLALTQRLIDQAKGLAYDVARMDRDFARLYPCHRERRPDVPGHAGTLEEHAHQPADRDADAGPGLAEPQG